MTQRKGIILAGGSGTRLYPITMGMSKQLLPIYDKPMVYYPLSVLMLGGMREVAIITTPHDQEQFQRMLGDGSQWGMDFTYIIQPSPDGLAQAFILAEEFLDGAPSALVLGDNIFFGHALPDILRRADEKTEGCTVFGYRVKDPERYGVVGFNADGVAHQIIEKPEVPPSNFAVTGLYFLDATAPERAKIVKPSARSELEITTLLEMYLADGKLSVERMGRGYPASADEEGDPVSLAEARTTTFAHRRKVFMVSTPTIRGLSRIEREFEASDQRRYFVPCPHCDHMQWLQFERLRWDKGQPETVAYACEGCDASISEHHKTDMLARGEWRATATSADPNAIGFHLSALYSPIGWKSWEQIARDWLAAQGSDEMLRAARNTLLGETWVESGDAPEWQRLADRRESFPAQVPLGGLFLTAGADVQKDRIEVDVWAWGRSLESWLVDHVVIPGGPGDPACWQALTALLGQTWVHENGAVMPLAKLAIDTGYETSAVYAWARAQGIAQVAPVKGLEGFNRATPVSGPTFVDATVNGRKLKRGARLWTVATATFKAETYRYLRLERPSDEDRSSGVPNPTGMIHLPDWADSEWLKQLVAEQLVTIRDRRGYARQEWQKMRERNEALDTRVYARAAAWILGADRFDERMWRQLERQAGVETVVTSHTDAPEKPTEPQAGRVATPRRRGWKISTPKYME